MPDPPGSKKRGADQDRDDADPSVPTKKPRKAKAYVPVYRSGAHALVLALASLDENAPLGLTKTDLIALAQPHCDSSFSVPSEPGKFYTAWNSMKTLVQKELVYERGRPLKRYALTDEGWDVARRVQRVAADRRDENLSAAPIPAGTLGSNSRTDSVSQVALSLDDKEEPLQDDGTIFADVVSNGVAVSGNDSFPCFTPIQLAPGTFTVHMVLDTREVRAKTDRDYLQEELAKKGVKPITRALGLGDVLWVAKIHDSDLLARHGAEGDEVVLDWVLERKRLDDLIGSIKDGRFHEQKFRLRRCGVKNVVYLVEEISMDPTYFQKYEEAVQSAIAATQVVNGFFIKRTQKMDDSIRYLAQMTLLLKKQYEGKTLQVVPTRVITAGNYLALLTHLREQNPSQNHYISYPAFASLASKSETMTLRDVYLKMLMCTRGVTGDKAMEIQKQWKTPYDLIKAYERCGPAEIGDRRRKEMLSSQLHSVVPRQKITRALSQKVSEIWGDS
jgi:crossover junction endonuclease MUS81